MSDLFHNHPGGALCSIANGGETQAGLLQALPIIFENTLVVAFFVLTIMLLVEYANTLWPDQGRLIANRSRFMQYLICSLLGTLPGCFGVFAVVTFYTHRMVSLGALVAASIATSGDEAFVMFAINPLLALVLHVLLFVLAMGSAYLVDHFRSFSPAYCEDMVIHHHERPKNNGWDRMLGRIRTAFKLRLILIAVHVSFFTLLITGNLGHSHDSWLLNLGLFVVALLSFFVLIEAPAHFLQEHFLHHIVRKHAPRLIFWTFVAYVTIQVVFDSVWLQDLVRQNPVTTMIVAVLVGLIPESGPHIIFFSMYQAQQVPFAVLLASSIVQDGHGLLPMLSHSLRQFAMVKAINAILGLLAGFMFLGLGVMLENLLGLVLGGLG
ncbi:MAG: arsenic efflux protein [Candidatus Cloacimonetes bacterium]|nr:arsenic efflux protein [Candidatus Cloacimonadota bacterium]